MLGIALTTGCTKRPSDAAIVSQIQSQISSDTQFLSSDIRVSSANGEVTLSGTVPTDAAHQEAHKIATKTPGVKKVNDQVTVAEALPAADSPLSALDTAPTTSASERKASRSAPRANQPFGESIPASQPETFAKTAPVAPLPVAPEVHSQQAAPPPSPVSAAVQPLAPPEPRQVEIPANTTASIRMIDSVDSSVNHAGEIFHGMLEAPFMVEEEVIVPRGADVYIRLVSASRAGRFKGKSELHLELVKLDFQGRSYSLVSSTYSLKGKSRGKSTAKKAGAGAVLGAIIGGIAGGGAGAAVGATVGGGAGAAVGGLTRGQEVKIPAETMLDFQLEAPVTVMVMPHRAAAAFAAQ